MTEKANFAITEEAIPGGIKLTVVGRIDSVNAVKLGDKFDQAIQGGHINIILDMPQVDYLCSMGVRVILKAYKDAKKAGGKFKIEGRPNAARVLGMAGLNELLP